MVSSRSRRTVLTRFKIQRSFRKAQELGSSQLFVKVTANSKDLFQFSQPEVTITAGFLYLVYGWDSDEIFSI